MNKISARQIATVAIKILKTVSLFESTPLKTCCISTAARRWEQDPGVRVDRIKFGDRIFEATDDDIFNVVFRLFLKGNHSTEAIVDQNMLITLVRLRLERAAS